MPRRGDNIRKRKDGRWEARYVQEDREDSEKKYGSVYGKSYQEVKEKREQIVAMRRKQPTRSASVLLRDVLAAWQEANRINLKASSFSRYQNLIDSHILPELGNKRMGQINSSVINRFLSAKLEDGRLDHKGGLSPAYVRSIALVISSAIAFGVSEKMCSPMQSSITKPALTKKELTVLNPDKQTTLENELLEDMNGAKLLIYITLYTGIRIGEACALRWEDAELLNQAIEAAAITHDGITGTATFDIPKMVLANDNQFNGTVEFTAYDRSENSTELKDTTRIVVDNISPTATITYNNPVQDFNDISYYDGNIEATIAINEANFDAKDVIVSVTKDGTNYPVNVSWRDNSVDSHTGSFVLTEDGDYIVSVQYKDKSGNQMADYKSNELTLDTTAPVIKVSDIKANSANKDAEY